MPQILHDVFPAIYLIITFALGALAQRWYARWTAGKSLASLDQVASVLPSVERELAAQRGETETARRRADEYFGLIEGVTKEARDAVQLYIECGASHGVAQSMMLREIESLAHQYRALAAQYTAKTNEAPPRPEPILNRTIQIVADDFRDEHVTPHAAPAPPNPSPVPSA